ncbi:MAG: D-alanine--D-alanine ligase, partial [Thiohalospira sp.]
MTAVVLMGGWSAERPISLKSGQAVLAALQQAGVAAEALDIDGPAAVRALADGTWERAFIALHGRGGEDGV